MAVFTWAILGLAQYSSGELGLDPCPKTLVLGLVVI